MMEPYVRYCPDCGEEYQPHMTQCIDCGTALVDRLDRDVPKPQVPPEPEPEASIPPGDYRPVTGGLTAQAVEPVVKLLAAAGIPVKVESRGYDLFLSARLQDRPAVIAILEREGVISEQPDAGAPAIGADGGPCPACGVHMAPGTVECPECGLSLGTPACESCGAELSPADHACPACGHPLE